MDQKRKNKRKRLLRLAALGTCLGLLGAGISGCGVGNGAKRQELRLQAIEQMDSGDYSGAISVLDEALDLGKGSVGAFEIDILQYRAEAEFRAEDYAAAAHTYDVLLQVDEERPEYIRLRCISSIRSGDVDAALEDFQNLYSQTGEEDPEAMGQLAADVGMALESAGRTQEALEIYSQAQADGLANSIIYNRIGLCRMAKEAYIQAEAAFAAGLECPDKTVEADLMFNRAVALEYQGEYQQALAAFEEYTARFGQDDKAQHEIDFLRTR